MSKKKEAEPQVCVDASKFSYTCDHLNNQVDYAVGHSDKPIEQMVPEDAAKWRKINYVCFSGFGSYTSEFQSTSKKNPNRLYFKLTVHKDAYAILDDTERERWIVLAKMHGLLPPYIKEDAIEKREEKKGNCNLHGEFFFDIEKMPAALLYIYLSTLRNMREDPGLPKVVIHLVDDLGMNFYAAYVFGSRVAITSTGHHILEVYRPYGERYNSDEDASKKISTLLQASARIANCLRRFVHEPEKYDTRMASSNCRLTASSAISSVMRAGCDSMLTLPEFFDEDVIQAIMSLSDVDFTKHMKSFESKKLKIVEAGANE